MFGKISAFQNADLILRLHTSKVEILLLFLFHSPSAWWLCRRRSLCEQRSQTQNTDGQKKKERELDKHQTDWEALWAKSWIPAVYLIVKRSVGPLFDGSLLLLIPDLDNHAGVNVLPHQLPGFCDVNGNLWNKVEINSQVHFLMKPNPIVTL